MSSLLRQALGLEAASEAGWEQLERPYSELLPSIAEVMDPSTLSARAKGLKKYTWLRYQLALTEAQKVLAMAPHHLLLADDLHLAGLCYPSPSARVLTGIDFLLHPAVTPALNSQLCELGWRKPDWADPPGESHWMGKESILLRLHTEWLHYWRAPWDFVFEQSVEHHGFRGLSPAYQLCRSCRQGPSHLWPLDAHYLLRKFPECAHHLPRPLQVLARAWNRGYQREVGASLGLPERGSRTLAEWVLQASSEGSDPYTRMLQEMALELAANGESGGPMQWLHAVCRRWGLGSVAEIPWALWKRLRGDFR